MTYTIRNLLPPRPPSPLALITEAVLIDIHEPLPPPPRHLRQRPRPVSKPLQRPGAVPVEDDVRLFEEPLKGPPAGGGLEVELGGPLAHVAVDLEEGHVAEPRARHLEHVGAVLAQDAAHHGPRDDAAQLEDLDAREDAPVGGGLG